MYFCHVIAVKFTLWVQTSVLLLENFPDKVEITCSNSFAGQTRGKCFLRKKIGKDGVCAIMFIKNDNFRNTVVQEKLSWPNSGNTVGGNCYEGEIGNF